MSSGHHRGNSLRYALPVLLVFSATPALAQSVDSAGADTLTANIARYIGSTAFDKGVVRIAVDGDAYKVEVDFNKLASLFPIQDKVALDIEPYVLHIKPRADAAWDVSGDLSPNGRVEIAGEAGPQVSQWQVADDSFTGVYDPALAGFSVASATHGALSVSSSDPTSSSEYTAASGHLQMQSAKSATSGVDFTALQTMADMVQTMRINAPEIGMVAPIVMRSPELSYSTTAKGFQSQPLLDLLAFAVANADETKIKAAQPQLKTLLRNALPLWGNLAAAYGWHEFSINTPMGDFGASSAAIETEMTGVRKDATITYAIRLKDLAVPDGLLPDWTMPLLPRNLDLNIGGTEIDLDGPVTSAIDAFDLNNDPPLPDAVGDAIVAKFLANPPRLTMSRSTIGNKDTEISAEGQMTFEGGKPAATATVEATGFDALMQAIQEASTTAPEAQQAFIVAVGAKGIAKTLSDGRLQWVIDMTADGAVTVNGAMVKPADTPQPQ